MILCKVVYGDTDSLFINSNVTELADALRISAEFKKAVNDRYKLLEIDLDSVFQRLLLLQKKKYAAIKVEDGTRTTIEIKGLDMKRREYCALSKNVSQYVPLSFNIQQFQRTRTSQVYFGADFIWRTHRKCCRKHS
jgi:DNA polymerase elongation subunit (family B)